MNVVDSSAWIEFFVDGPNARYFAKAVGDVESLLVPSVVILEVYRYILRQRGRQAALEAAASMRQGTVVDLDEGLAIEAAELGASHQLPLADSIIYASAVANEATLWTQDSDFEGLEGVRYRSKRGAL
ncbi:MAG: type II toxin-antitoxin system VapC family toxin [Gemmatimonadota bacterium]|nr:type II toxin-antitoxin system VapC family toxin [Gemmatimonadota bacterium]